MTVVGPGEPSGDGWRRRGMRRRVVGVVAAGLVLAGCGQPPPGAVPGTPGGAPSREPAPAGALTTRSPATVLDAGDGAQVCLGGVMESFPPQCQGVPLSGWDWADHEGAYEEAGPARWGDFTVTGTFDGTTLTVTDAVPGAPGTGSGDVPEPDFSSPCPEPAGGWADDPLPLFADEAVLAAARARADYAGGWVTQRDPRSAEEVDQLVADDPEAGLVPPVVNIRVTGDPAAAEADLRPLWDGPLCVTAAERTEAELVEIQTEVTAVDGVLGSGPDTLTGTLDVQVVHDDGTFQAELDERYGAGVVRVESALVPVS